MAGRTTSKNWLLIAVFIALCVVGLLTLMMIGALNTGPGGLIVGVLLAALPVPFYLALAAGSLPGTVFVRGVLAPFSHPLFTAMTGVGLGIARETTKRSLKLIAPLAGLCLAMALHGTWNLSASFGAAFLGVYVLVMVPTFLALLGIVLYAQARERRIIRANLLPYVQTGHLSPAELQALCVFGGRMKTLYAAASRG